MSDAQQELEDIRAKRANSEVYVATLGRFELKRLGVVVSEKDWGRDKTKQLFQFLITARHRHGLHKEQIVDRLWDDSGADEGGRDFKVAMHGVNKTLEPNRKSRAATKYVLRQGLSYRLDFQKIWIDVEQFDAFIELGNEYAATDKHSATAAYKEAIKLYKGVYLPNRVYEDWASMERERLQVLALGAYIALGELLLDANPLESIRLSQQALIIDHTWEDAYRLQMQAYFRKGNRPNAIKAYKRCADVLDDEYGIEPLPETKRLLENIKGA